MQNDHDFSSAAVPARPAAGFIGTAGRSVLILGLALAPSLVSCDETRTTDLSHQSQSTGQVEPVNEPMVAPTEPREVRWTPDGGTAAAPAQQDPAAVADAPHREGWAVVLAAFTDADHRELATAYLAKFQEVTPFAGAWIETDERGSTVRYGSYSSLTDKQAQDDLNAIKDFVYNGGRPFSRAYLSRFGLQETEGRLREYHLSQARRYLPGERTVYSLQIGVYEAEKDTTTGKTTSADEARRLAEQAAVQLRAQSELAFYYHGPNRSMVCVGVFPESAVDVATGLYSPEVMALQRRFPHNSLNGRTLKQKIVSVGGKVREELQPSFLVLVPEQ
ncbi:MAG: hypothetical protein IT430_00315 [Phycisphaerales bacterium]|nr:hypothetical protein [Phycisphaerales bacterium]